LRWTRPLTPKSILVYSLSTHSRHFLAPRHSLALCIPTCATVLLGYIDGLTIAAIIYHAL
jgi:hypothetical protein